MNNTIRWRLLSAVLRNFFKEFHINDLENDVKLNLDGTIQVNICRWSWVLKDDFENKTLEEMDTLVATLYNDIVVTLNL